MNKSNDFPLPVWYYTSNDEAKKKRYILWSSARQAIEANVIYVDNIHKRHGLWKYKGGHSIEWNNGVMWGQYISGKYIMSINNPYYNIMIFMEKLFALMRE